MLYYFKTELTKIYGESYMASYLAVLNRPNGAGATSSAFSNIVETVWQNTGDLLLIALTRKILFFLFFHFCCVTFIS